MLFQLTQLLQRLLERNESPLAPEDACEIESPTLVEDLLAMNRRFGEFSAVILA